MDRKKEADEKKEIECAFPGVKDESKISRSKDRAKRFPYWSRAPHWKSGVSRCGSGGTTRSVRENDRFD
jgi:hypothetical protein